MLLQCLSVIYTEEGVFQEYRFYRKNPDLVLVDTQVIAQAPPRSADRRNGRCTGDLVRGENLRRRLGAKYAGWWLDRERLGPGGALLPHALGGWGRGTPGCLTQAVTPALERLVEANTLLSGLGFESSGLAAAHAVHNGLTAAPETHPSFHGEKVAFGLLVQLVLEGAPRTTMEEVLGFSAEVGLPITLADIGLTNLPATGSPQSPSATAPARPSTTSRLRSRPIWSPTQYSPPTQSDGRGGNHEGSNQSQSISRGIP